MELKKKVVLENIKSILSQNANKPPILLSFDSNSKQYVAKKMVDSKWSTFDKVKKTEIQSVVQKRNDRVLDSVNSEDLEGILQEVKTQVGEAEKPTEKAEKPTEKAEKSTEEAEKPTEETEKPTEETEKPKEETEKPKEEAEKPKEETEKPTEETEKPAEETEKPKEETEKPTEETEKPAEETEKPAEETEKPKEEAEKPKEEKSFIQEAPVISSVSAAGGEVSNLGGQDFQPSSQIVGGNTEAETFEPTQSNAEDNDLDLTPNFVNVFFSYVNGLLNKPNENVSSTDNDISSGKETVVENSPDYSNPSECESLPDCWERHISKNSDPGRVYYYNTTTNETRWDKPPTSGGGEAKTEEGETKKDEGETKKDEGETKKDEAKTEEGETKKDEAKTDSASPESSNTSSGGALPPGWTAHVSENSRPGETYYYNSETDETRWEKPSGESTSASDEDKTTSTDGALPPGWTAHVSESSRPGETYYYNSETDETTWEKPSGGSKSASDEDKKSNAEKATKEVVAGRCYKCGSKENLNLLTYKLESEKAVPVEFCSMKCFEGIEFLE